MTLQLWKHLNDFSLYGFTVTVLALSFEIIKINKYTEIFKMMNLIFLVIVFVGYSRSKKQPRFWKIRTMLKCLKPAFPPLWLYRSLWENEANSHMIYDFSELVPNNFKVLISSFKSSSIQHDVHLINDGLI